MRLAPGAGRGQRGAPRWRMHQRGWRRSVGAAAAAEWTQGRVCARAWPRLAAPVQRAAAVHGAIGRTEQLQVVSSAGCRCFKPWASVPHPCPQGAFRALGASKRARFRVARVFMALEGPIALSFGALGRRRPPAEALAGAHLLPRNRTADLAACRRGPARSLPSGAQKSALGVHSFPLGSPAGRDAPVRALPGPGAGAGRQLETTGEKQAGRSDVGREARKVARRSCPRVRSEPRPKARGGLRSSHGALWQPQLRCAGDASAPT